MSIGGGDRIISKKKSNNHTMDNNLLLLDKIGKSFLKGIQSFEYISNSVDDMNKRYGNTLNKVSQLEEMVCFFYVNH